jgi:hypothetical protein
MRADAFARRSPRLTLRKTLRGSYLLFLFGSSILSAFGAEDSMLAGFQNPPAAARPYVWSGRAATSFRTLGSRCDSRT